MDIWYANHGRKFHKAASDWIRSGKGVCGEDIRRPVYTIHNDAAFRQACEINGRDPYKNLCKLCLKD